MGIINNAINQLHLDVNSMSTTDNKVPATIVDVYHDLRLRLIEKGFGVELGRMSRDSSWPEMRVAVGQMKAISDYISFAD